MNFSYHAVPKIIMREGSVKEAGALFPHSPLLIVTDKGMVETGLLARLTQNLSDFHVFDRVIADPPEEIVLAAVAKAKAIGAKAVIGFGGGSPMDVAKLVALLACSGENLSEIYGINNVKGKRLPLMLIPTTAGTGSEVTPISIVTTGNTTKMGVISPVLLPCIALLDAELTYNLPRPITAATGIDAMVHAIEAFTSKNANHNPISQTLALEALRMMGKALPLAVKGERTARAPMLLGAMLAGQAFANSPVAAVHALAYPLGGFYKLPHGLTNALVLPHVIRFNALKCDYSAVCAAIFDGKDDFAIKLAKLSQDLGLKPRLRDYGVPESDLPLLAQEAMKQTRLLVNNPREVRESDALAIYTAAW